MAERKWCVLSRIQPRGGFAVNVSTPAPNRGSSPPPCPVPWWFRATCLVVVLVSQVWVFVFLFLESVPMTSFPSAVYLWCWESSGRNGPGQEILGMAFTQGVYPSVFIGPVAST